MKAKSATCRYLFPIVLVGWMQNGNSKIYLRCLGCIPVDKTVVPAHHRPTKRRWYQTLAVRSEVLMPARPSGRTILVRGPPGVWCQSFADLV
jgi:hypothetical protein